MDFADILVRHGGVIWREGSAPRIGREDHFLAHAISFSTGGKDILGSGNPSPESRGEDNGGQAGLEPPAGAYQRKNACTKPPVGDGQGRIWGPKPPTAITQVENRALNRQRVVTTYEIRALEPLRVRTRAETLALNRHRVRTRAMYQSYRRPQPPQRLWGMNFHKGHLSPSPSESAGAICRFWLCPRTWSCPACFRVSCSTHSIPPKMGQVD